MSERLRERFRRYLNYLRCLAKLQVAPILLWKDYQPKIHRLFHPYQEKNMSKNLLSCFKGKSGICIGGALRWEFQEYLQQASEIVNVDVVPFYSEQQVQPDYLTDAGDLYFAGTGEFDFVCSSHVFEHLTNPVKALKEWMRVLKENGIIYCGVPDKRFTFDHKRRRTSLRHLVEDYQRDVGLKDAAHLWDIFFNTDENLTDDTPERRFRWTLDYYMSMYTKTITLLHPHHHVYAKEDLVALFRYVGLEIVFVTLLGDTVHLVAKKSKAAENLSTNAEMFLVPRVFQENLLEQ